MSYLELLLRRKGFVFDKHGSVAGYLGEKRRDGSRTRWYVSEKMRSCATCGHVGYNSVQPRYWKDRWSLVATDNVFEYGHPVWPCCRPCFRAWFIEEIRNKRRQAEQDAEEERASNEYYELRDFVNRFKRLTHAPTDRRSEMAAAWLREEFDQLP